MGKPTMEDLREAFRSATRKARSKPPKWKTITCARCGIEVSTMAKSRKYCPDCAKEARCVSKPGGKKKPHVSQIDEIQRAAQAAGMSYGRYVAMMEMQKGA